MMRQVAFVFVTFILASCGGSGGNGRSFNRTEANEPQTPPMLFDHSPEKFKTAAACDFPTEALQNERLDDAKLLLQGIWESDSYGMILNNKPGRWVWRDLLVFPADGSIYGPAIAHYSNTRDNFENWDPKNLPSTGMKIGESKGKYLIQFSKKSECQMYFVAPRTLNGVALLDVSPTYTSWEKLSDDLIGRMGTYTYKRVAYPAP